MQTPRRRLFAGLDREVHAGDGARGGHDVNSVRSSLSRQSMLVAAVCLLVDAVAYVTAGPLAALRPQDWAVLAAVVVVDAALALPSRFSGWVALAHAVVLVGGAVLLGGAPILREADSAGALIAAYRAGAFLRGGAASSALLALMVGAGVGEALIGRHGGAVGIIVEMVKTAILPWLVGRYTTARRAYIAELEQRAESQRRDAQAAIEHAVAEERGAIARDLHDVISHHVSAIGMHAGAARLSIAAGGSSRSDPIGAVRTRTAVFTESLLAVETASRAAMVDLRRLLDLLYRDRGATTRQPGLDNLDELLDGVRGAGLPIRLRTRGHPRPLPGSLDIALYRITQEMLTNALRHGDGRGVDIDLDYQRDSIILGVSNGITAPLPTGRADSHEKHGPARTTRGLSGVRTRAMLFQGAVTYGPDPAGRRWETTATFPIPTLCEPGDSNPAAVSHDQARSADARPTDSAAVEL
ncbi:MAG TPA: histidine kinase [Pseudonocardia sp.]